VSGNQILDSRSGAVWIPHAVNWPSFEYACQQGWADAADGATASAASAMRSWGVNAVRIPLNQDCWLGVDGAPSYGTAAGYRAALAAWVATLNGAGLVVILDLHWTAPSGFPADGQRAMPDAQSVTFWSQAAAAYRDSPSVLFETFNEPYSRGSYALTWDCWAHGGCTVPSSNDQSSLGSSTYAAHGMVELVAAIRATGAAQPILLDGIDYANDLRGWLAHRPADGQLIASWHNYPGQRCDDTSCWNAEVAPVAATVPVITTEFGETDGGNGFLVAVMAWADAHGIGYAPWAWWVTDPSDGTDANRYALITDLTDFAPRAPSGTAFHDHLATLVPPPPSPPPSPDSSFVRAAYADVLGRTPSSGEVAGWTRLLAQGAPRSAVASGFNNSDEYRLHLIDLAYLEVLGRPAESGGRLSWLNGMRAGALQPDDVHRIFLSTDEFFATKGGGSDSGYIRALYQDVIGRPATDPEVAYWVTLLGRLGRQGVVNGFWFAAETINGQSAALFTTFLGRPPSAGEVTSWAAVVRASGLTGARNLIMSSAEYGARAVARFP